MKIYTSHLVLVSLFGWLIAGVAQPASAILLNNADSDHPIFYLTVGSPASGPNFYVEMLAGPDANHLQPITDVSSGTQSVFNLGTAPNLPGFFDGGMGHIPGVPFRGVATFQVLAWTGAPTFDSASQRVASALFTQQTGYDDPGGGAPDPAKLLAFPADLVIPGVPEPSVVALGLLGGTVWLILGRRR
jgi:hypothetical protein